MITFNIKKLNFTILFLNPFGGHEAKVMLFNIYYSNEYKYFQIDLFNICISIQWE